MESVFDCQFFSGLVGHMTGVAAHIESDVPAALVGNVEADAVAIEAKILFFSARNRLEELILVVAGVRIVAGETGANRGRVDSTLDIGRFLVRMASNT